MANDPHADAVYEWEGDFADWNRKTLTLADVRRYIRTACAHYKLKAPPVRQLSGKQWPYCAENGSHIAFSDWGKNPAVALHEAAHFITLNLCPTAQDHGPTWLGIYMWLLEKAAVAPAVALAATARRHGLRWRHLPPTRF